MNKDRKQIIFKGMCIDNNDPERLGRIRARDLTIHKGELESASLTDGRENVVPWSKNDPFLYNPLLPWFINPKPKGITRDGEKIAERGEYVHLFYSNLDRKEGSNDRYYIGGVFSSPLTVNREPYESAVTFLDEGTNNERSQPKVTDLSGNTIDSVSGLFAEPDEIFIGGRGDSDILIKDNDLILRSGKMFKFENKELPQKNDGRAFLQLSKFDFKKEIIDNDSVLILKKEHKTIQKLLEYHISNSDNPEDRFSGMINIFHLGINEISTSNIGVDTVIPPGKKQLQSIINFSSLSLKNVKNIINDTLKEIKLNSSIYKIEVEKEKYYDNENSFISVGSPDNENNQTNFSEGSTPFYYRPSSQLLEIKANPTINALSYATVSNLMGGIKISENNEEGNGFGLIYSKDKNSVPTSTKKDTSRNTKYEEYNKTVGLFGANEVFLLSHDSKKYDKEPIDLSDTLGGINENKIVDELKLKTSSLVRGEELYEFLNLIVRFLVSHVHEFHQTVPSSQGDGDSITTDILLAEKNKFMEKVLNKNIRIN